MREERRSDIYKDALRTLYGEANAIRNTRTHPGFNAPEGAQRGSSRETHFSQKNAGYFAAVPQPHNGGSLLKCRKKTRTQNTRGFAKTPHSREAESQTRTRIKRGFRKNKTHRRLEKRFSKHARN